jgi:hypothetical protein
MRKVDKRTEENIKKLKKFIKNENIKFNNQKGRHILLGSISDTNK